MRHLLLIFFSLVFCVSAVAATPQQPFCVPACVTEKRTDASGKTWQMTGVATNSFANVRMEFYTAIREAGYEMRHEIPMDKSGERVLVAWKKKDRNLIVMLWPVGEGKVGFAWGETVERNGRGAK